MNSKEKTITRLNKHFREFLLGIKWEQKLLVMNAYAIKIFCKVAPEILTKQEQGEELPECVKN